MYRYSERCNILWSQKDIGNIYHCMKSNHFDISGDYSNTNDGKCVKCFPNEFSEQKHELSF